MAFGPVAQPFVASATTPLTVRASENQTNLTAHNTGNAAFVNNNRAFL